jgi:23S rRNA (uracil1939-C5)-methyltransferase
VLFAVRDKGGLRLGFREEGSHALVDIAECPVLAPAIVNALTTLREISVASVPEGGEVRLTVTATAAGLDVAIEAEGVVAGAGDAARLAGLAARAGVARLMLNGDLIALRATPALTFAGVDVRLPAGAFVQAVPEAEAIMTGLLVAATAKARQVADLFCGIGTFTLPLARKARVLAVDGNRAAIAALKDAALRAPGLKAIEAKVRDLAREPLSRKELAPFDAVVFDPPRAGARAQAEALAKSKVGVVIAVSCNPATLARDARILVDGGYCIDRVTPIDQFVFSAELETVAVLRR